MRGYKSLGGVYTADDDTSLSTYHAVVFPVGSLKACNAFVHFLQSEPRSSTLCPPTVSAPSSDPKPLRPNTRTHPLLCNMIHIYIAQSLASPLPQHSYYRTFNQYTLVSFNTIVLGRHSRSRRDRNLTPDFLRPPTRNLTVVLSGYQLPSRNVHT